uniref:DNA-directed RNA polymerase n=1 Tax=Anolis carolinensis TaxID=28377 RepID=H9G3S4_ANOCA
FFQEYVWEASHYLVQQVFSSLKEMFSGTREIQGWLTDCARLIAKSGRTVEWVTPLGLPIIQPYHRSKNTMVNSSMQTVNLRSRHDINQKPDTVKQKNAFPPNFIHSLDSTHMMLTSLHCHRQGLTFVSVHDCYWTHALTVDVMNRVRDSQNTIKALPTDGHPAWKTLEGSWREMAIESSHTRVRREPQGPSETG